MAKSEARVALSGRCLLQPPDEPECKTWRRRCGRNRCHGHPQIGCTGNDETYQNVRTCWQDCSAFGVKTYIHTILILMYVYIYIYIIVICFEHDEVLLLVGHGFKHRTQVNVHFKTNIFENPCWIKKILQVPIQIVGCANLYQPVWWTPEDWLQPCSPSSASGSQRMVCFAMENGGCPCCNTESLPNDIICSLFIKLSHTLSISLSLSASSLLNSCTMRQGCKRGSINIRLNG